MIFILTSTAWIMGGPWGLWIMLGFFILVNVIGNIIL